MLQLQPQQYQLPARHSLAVSGLCANVGVSACIYDSVCRQESMKCPLNCCLLFASDMTRNAKYILDTCTKQNKTQPQQQ